MQHLGSCQNLATKLNFIVGVRLQTGDRIFTTKDLELARAKLMDCLVETEQVIPLKKPENREEMLAEG